MPKVSVVIPTRNRADVVSRAITSVLTQTFSDFELVIVDDGSTDRTGELIRQIGDSRIKYLRHDTSRGVSVARNAAIARASGEFIAFLDDDDEWLPEKLRLQIECFERAPKGVGVVTTGYRVQSGAARIVEEVMPSQRGWMFENVLRRGSFDHTSTVLARAECFDRVGPFDVTLRYAEDLDMWLRIAGEYQMDFVARLLVRVYPQVDGLSNDHTLRAAGMEAHLRKFCDFFDSNGHVFSDRLKTLGTDYCFAGNTRRGRQLFYRAIAHRPLSVKSYMCVALSFMGSRAVRSCYRWKEALTTPGWSR
jgi:glycosyltransferase involved in cell wall biosynthesis